MKIKFIWIVSEFGGKSTKKTEAFYKMPQFFEKFDYKSNCPPFFTLEFNEFYVRTPPDP